MKRSLILLCVFLLLCTFTGLFAQDEEPFENPTYGEDFIAEQEAMLGNLDTLFPRTLLKETYDYDSGGTLDKFDGFTFLSKNHGGKRELTVTAEDVSEGDEFNRGWSLFNQAGSYENFYFRVDVRIVEQDESNSGWVWFQYSNQDLVGDANRDSGEIIFPDKIDTYETVAGERTYTTFYNLNEYENDYEEHTLEMIRLNGYTSAFIDGHFIVGFEDGFTGRFYHLYGVGLHAGGKYATYAFDNFTIRR